MLKTLQILGDSKYGGATYLMIEWCRYLVNLGCQVAVLSTNATTVGELRRIQRLRVLDNIFIPRSIGLRTDFKAFDQLFRILRVEHYDVVHTYTSAPAFLGRITARLAGVPVILNHQAGWPVSEFSPLLQRLLYTPLEYLAVAFSTRSICVSHAVVRQARKLRIAPQQKLVTICNGIDPQPFVLATQHGVGKTFRQEIDIPDTHLLIGNTGRLTAQKENETLIRAMVSLKSLIWDTPFTLLLVGDGPDQNRLEYLIHSLDLSEQVRLLGFRNDIPKFLAAIDVFVNPSLWEGLSISLLEAMASAKPIVTSSILPNAELIEHEMTGLLVPPKAPEEIAKAIVRFVREPCLAQRCAAAARKRVLEYYTLDRMFRETWDLYVTLLEQKRKSDI